MRGQTLTIFMSETTFSKQQMNSSSLDLEWDDSPVQMSTVENCPYPYTLNEDSAPSYHMEPGGASSQFTCRRREQTPMRELGLREQIDRSTDAYTDDNQ